MSVKSKALAGLGLRTLKEYVDSLPAHRQQNIKNKVNAMGEIKTGLWQSTLDGSYIKVTSVLEAHITYSDEGCAVTHVMNKRELIGCYRLVEENKPASVVKSTSTRLEKIIQAAIEIRTELNLIEDSTGGGEIQWAEAMTEPVNKLVVALNDYQLGDTFNNDNPRVWININDDSCINVSRIGSKYAYYSEEGSLDSHSMDIKYFSENYRLAGIGEKLAPVVDIAIGSPWLALKSLEKVEVTGVKVFDDGVDDVWFTKNGRIDILTRDKFLRTHTPLLIGGSPAPVVDGYGIGSVWQYRELPPVTISSVDEYKAYFMVDGEERNTPKMELKTPDWKCLSPAPAVDDTFNDATPAQTFDTSTKYMTKVPNVWRRVKKKSEADDTPKAAQILNEAVATMVERGKSYDKDGNGSERSMDKIVAMFEALTSISLTPAQGYKFMACLKLARSEQGEHKEDNYLDGAAYMALAGEAASLEISE